jgi:nitric oxide reductase NorQ protein
LDFPDCASELSIAVANSGLSMDKAKALVSIVRNFREMNRSKFVVSLRDSIKLCKIVQNSNISIAYDNEIFRKVCMDVLTSGISVQKSNFDRAKVKEELETILKAGFQEHGRNNGGRR